VLKEKPEIQISSSRKRDIRVEYQKYVMRTAMMMTKEMKYNQYG